jgi:hypothetical protein
VELPGKSGVGINNEDFGTEFPSDFEAFDGDAFKKLIGKFLGLSFVNDQESSPWSFKIKIDDLVSKGLNVTFYFNETFGLIHFINIKTGTVNKITIPGIV